MSMTMNILPWLARQPRDKADTLLLLAAAVMVLAPHFGHLPLWICASVTATLLWRTVLTLRGKRLPPLWLLLPVALASMGGVYASYRTLLGRDAGVAMLALLLAFKLLEMRARRDLFVVVFLALFVLLTNFFYSQGMATALFMGLTLMLLLAAQLSFQYTGAAPPLAARLGAAGRILLLAAPLSLLLFIVFPRIQGPLWGLPGDARSGRSGLSDSMAPGTLSSLASSDEVAFRVRFLDPMPRQDQLYWRGLVLGDYDGRTWTRVPRRRGQREEVAVKVGPRAVRYQLTMEASGQRWLYALELTGPTLRVPGLSVIDNDELEFLTLLPVGRRLRYEASAWTDYRIQPERAPQRLHAWLELPAGFNPRTLALARTLQQPQPAASVDAVLRLFRQQPFSYTLEPPLLGHDAVDDFLFNSRAGFCEHYAGAFVVLMRAMQIPARVVTGYQGGEWNPLDGYLTVRQSEAHAWAEVWLPGQGWRRVDPTAAVAPERVTRNLARALPRSSPFGMEALLALQHNPDSWLGQLRLRLSAMNNAWNQWILDYNPDRQRSFLSELSNAFGHWPTALAVALVAGLLWLLRSGRRQPAPDPADALYHAFCRTQARRGYPRQPDEGPRRYGARLQTMRAAPARLAAMNEFLTVYGALTYGAAGPQAKAASLKTLRTLLPLC